MKFKPQVNSYAHQRQFLKWFWQKTDVDGLGSAGGAAFFDPGTGKTKTAYDFVSAAWRYRDLRRVLVICPINAMQVWDNQADVHLQEEIPFRVYIPSGSIAQKAALLDEVNNWRGAAPDDEIQIVILNYAAIIKRNPEWAIMQSMIEFEPDLVILDESHHIKNATAKQSKAAHTICGKSRYVLLLTGTPIGKNYLDLYSQLKAIDQRIWKAGWTKTGIMSWTDFRNNYAVWGGRTGYELKGYMNLEDLRERYEPHIRTARKESIHDMPQVTDTVVPVDISADARRVYTVFAKEGLVVHKRHLIEAPIPLTKLLRLQQMTGGWVHDEHGEIVEVQRDKLSILSDLLQDLLAAGESVVVFARFLAEIEAIASLSPGRGKWFDSVGRIQGSISHANRIQSLERFQQGGPNLLVIQSGAAEAMDGLQRACSYGIFYSSDYSLIHWNQARGRLDRVGQTKPVTFYHLQVRNSVDSLILEALQNKKDIERLVMDRPDLLLGS